MKEESRRDKDCKRQQASKKQIDCQMRRESKNCTIQIEIGTKNQLMQSKISEERKENGERQRRDADQNCLSLSAIKNSAFFRTTFLPLLPSSQSHAFSRCVLLHFVSFLAFEACFSVIITFLLFACVYFYSCSPSLSCFVSSSSSPSPCFPRISRNSQLAARSSSSCADDEGRISAEFVWIVLSSLGFVLLGSSFSVAFPAFLTFFDCRTMGSTLLFLLCCCFCCC